jgi:hypothetical protein
MVIHCSGYQSDPRHDVRVCGEGGCRAAVCAAHERRIEQGEAWLWVPWQRLKGASSQLPEGCLLMGEELAGYGLVIDADVRISSSLVLGAGPEEARPITTLTIDGRVLGAQQHVCLEVVLEPELIAGLQEALRFLRPRGQAHDR